ncbi:MBL fold metallo-hydrolase [Nitratireductor pacificus]|uniref:Metallo-beta-lactamase n=1 Tax=Nitratireductor pacificus pht-3B TaxID=391937 RepID=K2LHY5_9HYPH|nr:MBL fold metallo-hydrolase [Nitratireductor pacificus]EKF17359.1 Metallo-beta-lactamase [Nitratireductor pacificus pht-3B]
MMTRRDILIGGLALLGAGLPRPAGALGRFAAGDAEIIVVSDGAMNLPLGSVYPGLSETERDALLTQSGMPTDGYRPDCNVTFLRSGDRLAVFDVGAGPNFLPTTGKLAANLPEAGIDPADVTDVIFTHAHPDHLWGLLDDFDELIFPNAAHHMAEAEWDFWRADDTLSKMPEDRKSFVVGAQNRFAALEDRINLFKPGAEILPRVEAVDTAGHTPGHVSFMVHDGSGGATLIAGDAITNPVSFVRPDLETGSDQDRAMGAAARVRLLDRLAGDRARLVGFHLAHPGFGMAERDGSAYRFVAV